MAAGALKGVMVLETRSLPFYPTVSFTHPVRTRGGKKVTEEERKHKYRELKKISHALQRPNE